MLPKALHAQTAAYLQPEQKVSLSLITAVPWSLLSFEWTRKPLWRNTQ